MGTIKNVVEDAPGVYRVETEDGGVYFVPEDQTNRDYRRAMAWLDLNTKAQG